MPKVILLDLHGESSIGLRQLHASLAQRGIDAEILNLSKERKAGYEYSGAQYDVVDLDKSVSALKSRVSQLGQKFSKADIVAIPFYESAEELQVRLPLARFIKGRFPNTVLVGGGPGVTVNPEGFMKGAKLDYAIRGEAENSFPDLVQQLSSKRPQVSGIPGIVYRRNRKVIAARPARLTQKELKELELVNSLEEGEAGVFTERGCPHACIFCSVPNRGKTRYLADDKIIEGLKGLAKDESIKEVHFYDNHLFSNRPRARRLMQRIIDEGLHERFRFYGLMTVDSMLRRGKVHSEMIDLMKKANFMGAALGAEALSDGMLKELKSGRYTARQAMQVNDALRKAGISTRNFMLAGGVDTKAGDFLRSYYNALAKNARVKVDLPYHNPQIIEAYSGTPIREQAEKAGTLYSAKGRKVKPPKAGSVPRAFYALPKDPILRKFFAKTLKQGGPAIVPSDNVEGVLETAIRRGEPTGGVTRRQLVRELGRHSAARRSEDLVSAEVEDAYLTKAAKERGFDYEAYKKGRVTPEMMGEIDKARSYGTSFPVVAELWKNYKGGDRLVYTKRIREIFGVSPMTYKRLRHSPKEPAKR